MPSSNEQEKRIILCQHGWLGSGSASINDLLKNLEDYSEETEVNYVVFDLENPISERPLKIGSHDDEIEGDERIEYWLDDFEDFYALYGNDYHIFVQTEFKHPWVDSVDDQSLELKKFIKKITERLDYGGKFHLVGHSKGGLVNIKTALDDKYQYHDQIDKLVSIATPYGSSELLKVLSNLYDEVDAIGFSDYPNLDFDIHGTRSITHEDYLKQLREAWGDADNNPKKDDLYVIVSVAWEIENTSILKLDFEGSLFDVEFSIESNDLATDGVVNVQDQKHGDLNLSEENIIEVEENPENLPFREQLYYESLENVISKVNYAIENRIGILESNPLLDGLIDKETNLPAAALLLYDTKNNFTDNRFSHLNVCGQDETRNAVLTHLFVNS